MKDAEELIMCSLAMCLVSFLMPFYYNWASKRIGLTHDDLDTPFLSAIVHLTILVAFVIVIATSNSATSMIRERWYSGPFFFFSVASAFLGLKLYDNSDRQPNTPPS